MTTNAEPKYAWPTWWGTLARSDDPPGIVALARSIRDDVGGLKARSGTGAAFPVKSAKDLMAKLRTALDKFDGLCWVVGQDVTNIDVERGTACIVQTKVRLAAQDGSFVDFVGVGHGADTQDKAAGKASTYAWKDALTKGLDLPDADMVDTDDTDKPIPDGVKPRKGGKSAIGPEFNAETAMKALQACKTEAAVRTLMGKWREELAPDVALKVGPLAKARLEELSK